jgi:hypothetical protein
MNSTKLLQNSREGVHKTHHSMGSIRGSYQISRDDMDIIYNDDNLDPLIGIVEKPQYYSMLRFDLDYSSDNVNDKYEFEIGSITQNAVNGIREYLENNLQKIQPELLDCCILTKPSYINDKGKRKYGVHGQFHNLFISTPDFITFENYMKNRIKGFDTISKNGWLIYGQQKTSSSGFYKLDYVDVYKEYTKVKPEAYFTNYKIYSSNEKQVKFVLPLEHYYKQILSIIPFNRKTTDFITRVDEVVKKAEKEYKIRTRDFTREFNEATGKDEIVGSTGTGSTGTDFTKPDTEDIKTLVNMLSASRADDRMDWLKVGWCLHTIDEGYLSIWKDFSSKSDKYEESVCDSLWEKCNRDDIGIGSLYNWAKTDNEEAYKKFIASSKNSFVNVFSIPENERTKEQQEQVDKLLPIIKKANLDKLTETTLIKSIKIDDMFVQSSILTNSVKKVVVIKAGLGRGKSTSVSEYIKHTNKYIKDRYDNIIVLTPRRSYARSAKDRLVTETGLNFICYLDQKKSLLDEPYVVIQAESLFRLQINNGNNLVIIDEVEAFLSQLTSTKTHRENHVKNVETFIQLIKNSNKVIALDAFISNRSLKTFIQLSGYNHINFYEYTQKLKQRKATEVKDLKTFLESFVSDLEKGKKIFLFSSSNTKLLTTVKKTYKEKKDGTKKPDEIITALLPAIREKFPNKNIIEFHSKFITVQLTNVNEDWKNADVVACTSTVTVGCNFDTPNVFHKVYLYANASSKNLVRDMFQASWRIRHLIDDEMVFCLDENHYGSNLTTSIKQIRIDIEQKNELVLKLQNKYTQQNLSFPNDTPEFVKNLLYHNKLEQNLSIMSLRDVFERYLELCNYNKDDLDVSSIIEVEFDEFIADKIKYYDIPDITPSICKTLINKKKHTPLLELESLQVEKFHFQCLLLNKPEDVEEGLWKIYSNFGKGKFRNISIEKGITQGTCTIQDIIEKESYSHLNSGICLRLDLIREITSWIGMTNTSEYGYRLTKDKLDSIINNFEDNRQKIHIAFDMRDRTRDKLDGKTTIVLINKILDRWSYSSLKSDTKQKKIDGKNIRTTEFVIIGKNNDEIDIEKHIKPYGKQERDEKHPMLLCKEDKKVITDTELEMIRLNKY